MAALEPIQAPRKRYPGPKPFQQGQEHIFFGRDQDIADLFRTISVNDLTVLHGKSGLGKTSLLNAGVAPQFLREGWTVIFLRFHAYDRTNYPDALKTILSQLRPLALDRNSKTDVVFLPQIQPDPGAQTLWQQFKSIQWRFREQSKGVVVFFDQFEELFTYPQAVIEEFGRQLGEVLDNRMPDAFRTRFYENMETLKAVPDGEAAMLFIKKSLPLKLTLSIRSDRTSLVDRLKPFHEHVLRNLYELRPLTREQAQAAIEQPAVLTAELDTPRFSYAPETVAAILDFLTDKNLKPVESTQIQVICQHVENNLLHSEGQLITPVELGDIKAIYKQYYDRVIDALPAAEQPRARLLIENDLIFEPEQRRLSLYEGQVLKKILPGTLAALVGEHHLLRVEEHLGGGMVYELSHDSLVEPVLEAKAVREEAEALLLAETEMKEYARKEAEERARLRRQNRANLRFAIVTGALFLAALVFAITTYYQSAMARDARKQAEQKAFEAQEQRIIAEQKTAESQIERDSAVALRARLSSEIFNSWNRQGKLLMEQKRYSDALLNFTEALKIETPERNQAELQKLIATCRVGAAKEDKFSQLMRQAGDLRDQENYLEAYSLYQQALNLDFDNTIVADRLAVCEQRLHEQLREELRRAETFYVEGKSCSDANQTIQNYADPIIAVLQLPAKDELRIKRNKIWKKCPH